MSNSLLPFYRTRKFWTIVFITLLIISSTVFFLINVNGFRQGYWLFFDFIFSYGGATFILLAGKANTGIAFGLAYLLLVAYLLGTSFKGEQVVLWKTLSFSALYILGLVTALVYSGLL